MWQHVKLSEQIRPWDTLACCWDVKQQTNSAFLHFFIRRVSSIIGLIILTLLTRGLAKKNKKKTQRDSIQGNGTTTKKKKKKKNRPTGEACELLTWKRQETWPRWQLQSVYHSSPGFFFVFVFVFAFPSYISGVHHFWVRFLRMWPFFNPTIKVVTFRLRGWCVLGVFLLPAFTRLGHERQDLLSPCDEMHVCTD